MEVAAINAWNYGEYSIPDSFALCHKPFDNLWHLMFSYEAAAPKGIYRYQSLDSVELRRLEYGHRETIIALCIVAVLAVGGLICMAKGIEGGQAIIVAVLSFLAGYWVGGAVSKKSSRRSPLL
jgi:hypothetical protein